MLFRSILNTESISTEYGWMMDANLELAPCFKSEFQTSNNKRLHTPTVISYLLPILAANFSSDRSFGIALDIHSSRVPPAARARARPDIHDFGNYFRVKSRRACSQIVCSTDKMHMKSTMERNQCSRLAAAPFLRIIVIAAAIRSSFQMSMNVDSAVRFRKWLIGKSIARMLQL